MRRTALVVACFLLVAAAVSPALAQPTASSPTDVAADFNHDGFEDLAIGVPGEAIGDAQNEIAGAVNVLYGAGSGLSGTGGQLFSQVGGRVEFRDRFGSAQAAGTSTVMGSPTWPPAPRERTSVASVTPGP